MSNARLGIARYTDEHSETMSFGARGHTIGKMSVTTVDAYMKENGISHVNVLKIDTEGFEIWAMAGAEP